MSQQRIETICVQGGYTPGNGEPRQIPIVQSTTFKYATSEDMGKLFDLEASGYFYTRLQNPTNDYVAAKICALEGKLFIPAHAEPTEDIRPLAELNRGKVLEIIGVITDFCQEPRGFADILQQLFAHYQLTMDFNQYVLVGSTVRSYLAYLLDQGRVSAEFTDNRLLWRTI